MSESIYEIILTTRCADGSLHIAPMGVRDRGDERLIAPFRPSTTLDNLLREGQAVINIIDDVRVYAGCLTGHYDWPLSDCSRVAVPRLAACLNHQELQVTRIEDDELRPKVYCRIEHEEIHRPFRGYNRAQSAVLELAILVSRLHMLPWEKIAAEIDYLHIAIEKTASDRELQAWGWLMARVEQHRAQLDKDCA